MRKLIRDKLRDKHGREDTMVQTGSAEHMILLMSKLHEELSELAQSDFQDPSEYGDVMEVLRAIATLHGLSWVSILNQMEQKKDKRGSFVQGVVMEINTT